MTDARAKALAMELADSGAFFGADQVIAAMQSLSYPVDAIEAADVRAELDERCVAGLAFIAGG